MGKVSKGAECSVEKCKENAIKSISAEKIKKTDLKIKEERRAYLCREHYKEYKKKSKKDRTIEKWRLGSRGI